jgi:ribonuclease BN (tRNA processing enzyme)
MRLTVLGKSPAWTDAGGACSGYLAEHGATRLLLDCGNGVFGKLRALTDPYALDAVVISHLHADHVLDLVPFAYGLRFGRPAGPAHRPALHVPPGAVAWLRGMTGAWGSEDLVTDAFAVREYDPAAELAVGDLRLEFREVPHYVRTWAIALTPATGGGRIVYGADCAPNDAVVDLARGADVLLLEGTLTEPEPEPPRGHLTPAEAGALGARAGARRLVVTHVPGDRAEADVRTEAAGAFGGPVDVAREGAVFDA